MIPCVAARCRSVASRRCEEGSCIERHAPTRTRDGCRALGRERRRCRTEDLGPGRGHRACRGARRTREGASVGAPPDASPQVGSGDSRAHLALTDGLRLIRNESRHLKRELEQGKGREETLPVAKRLRSLIDSARVDARKLRLTSPLLDEIQATNATLAQLWEYYGLAADLGT